MENAYWTLESWGEAYPPKNANEIIDAANEMIDKFMADNPDADELKIADYRDKLWDYYCTNDKLPG